MAEVTRAGKFPLSSMGHGFIDRTRQDLDGIRFGVVYTNATHFYVYAKVDDTLAQNALNWVAEKNGEVMTVAAASAEIQADITALPDTTAQCSMGYTHTVNKTQLWQDVVNAANSI
jgi:hypothetical protein